MKQTRFFLPLLTLALLCSCNPSTSDHVNPSSDVTSSQPSKESSVIEPTSSPVVPSSSSSKDEKTSSSSSSVVENPVLSDSMFEVFSDKYAFSGLIKTESSSLFGTTTEYAIYDVTTSENDYGLVKYSAEQKPNTSATFVSDFVKKDTTASVYRTKDREGYLSTPSLNLDNSLALSRDKVMDESFSWVNQVWSDSIYSNHFASLKASFFTRDSGNKNLYKANLSSLTDENKKVVIDVVSNLFGDEIADYSYIKELTLTTDKGAISTLGLSISATDSSSDYSSTTSVTATYSVTGVGNNVKEQKVAPISRTPIKEVKDAFDKLKTFNYTENTKRYDSLTYTSASIPSLDCTAISSADGLYMNRTYNGKVMEDSYYLQDGNDLLRIYKFKDTYYQDGEKMSNASVSGKYPEMRIDPMFFVANKDGTYSIDTSIPGINLSYLDTYSFFSVGGDNLKMEIYPEDISFTSQDRTNKFSYVSHFTAFGESSLNLTKESVVSSIPTTTKVTDFLSDSDKKLVVTDLGSEANVNLIPLLNGPYPHVYVETSASVTDSGIVYQNSLEIETHAESSERDSLLASYKKQLTDNGWVLTPYTNEDGDSMPYYACPTKVTVKGKEYTLAVRAYLINTLTIYYHLIEDTSTSTNA